ncbi:MAG: HAMP domain-containing protein, partial [Cyanobacteria bacterium J06600_6]
IPASKVYEAANQLKLIVLGIVAAVFFAAIALINIFLRTSILQPIRSMATLSNEISRGNLNIEFDQSSKNEIGVFAKSLNCMVQSLKMAFETLEDEQQ